MQDITALDHIAEPQDALLANRAAGSIRHYVFPKGTVLFRKGDPRFCAFLLSKGTVHIYGNDEGGEDRLLCVLGEGEICGEMAMIDSAARSATAIAASECHIFVIPRDALQQRMNGLDPIISLLISLLIERYRASRVQLPETLKHNPEGHHSSHAVDAQAAASAISFAGPLHSSAEQRDLALREMKLEQELRTGLLERQFVPALQPILNLTTGRIAGFEALIRWQHPEKGLLYPDSFIPAAENTGVVQNLDRLMLEQACALVPQMLKIADEARETETGAGNDAQDFFISVNLSGVNFGAHMLVDRVRDILKASAVNPSNIRLEITESALIRDPSMAQHALGELRDLGIGIALDDFGTGYSSLGYLHKFPLDSLKIDRSFIANIHEGKKSMDILRAIVALGRNFNLKIVAEGIETQHDVVAVRSLGCDYGQGYYFGKPLSAENAKEFMRANLSQPGGFPL